MRCSNEERSYMPYFEYNGAKLYYEKKGNWDVSKYPILLMHGNGESMAIFDQTIEPLLTKMPFLALDTRGQGRSELVTQNCEFSYDMFADDAFALTQHLGINQFDIVGFSDGAITALLMASNPKTCMHVMRIVAVGANINPQGMRTGALKQIAHDKKVADSRGEKHKSALCSLMLTEPHITTDELAHIYACVAVVAGSNDIIKPAHTELIANSIIHAREIIIDGADHMIPEKHPDKLRAIILDELD